MKKHLKVICITLFIGFVAGLVIGEIHGYDRAKVDTFTAGYDAAMNHVRSTIEAKMPGLVPFYMADLGIQFIPRGVTITGIKYVKGSSPLTVTSSRLKTPETGNLQLETASNGGLR